MRWKITIAGSITLALMVCFGGLLNRYHTSAIEAQALTIDHAFTVWKYLCAPLATQSFVPDELRIAITFPPASPASAAGLGCNATNQVIGGLHGEASTNVLSCSMSGTDKFVTVKNVGPIHKISGHACRAEETWALQIYGDTATDLATLDLFVDASTATVPNAARKTDNKNTATDVNLYGSGPGIAGNALCDGPCGGSFTPDNDGIRNGEIVVGGNAMVTNAFVIFAKYRGDSGGPLVTEEWNSEWISL